MLLKNYEGKQKLEAVILRNLATDETKETFYDGVFVFIGLTPNNDLLKDKAELDERGFVKAPHMMTSLPEVFVAGDVRAGSTKQAASAAGEGASGRAGDREYLKSLGS